MILTYSAVAYLDWGSVPQCLLAITAIVAAVVAYRQYRSSKLFQLLQFLERPEIRQARYELFTAKEITSQDKWWERNTELVKVASDIAASYDIVWRVSRGGHRRMIRRYWAYSICWSYEDLQTFLISRRNAGDQQLMRGSRDCIVKLSGLIREKPAVGDGGCFGYSVVRKRRGWLGFLCGLGFDVMAVFPVWLREGGSHHTIRRTQPNPAFPRCHR